MTTGELYEACRWSQGSAYWRRKTEDLRLSVLARIASHIGAPVLVYIDEVLRELKYEPRNVVKRSSRDRLSINEDLLQAMAEVRLPRRPKIERVKRAARRG